MQQSPDQLAVILYRLAVLEQEAKAHIAPLDRALERIEVLKNEQIVQQEKIRVMTDQIEELKNDLKEAKKEIIESQRVELRRVIYVQGSILLIIAGAFVTLLFKVFFHT